MKKTRQTLLRVHPKFSPRVANLLKEYSTVKNKMQRLATLQICENWDAHPSLLQHFKQITFSVTVL